MKKPSKNDFKMYQIAKVIGEKEKKKKKKKTRIDPYKLWFGPYIKIL